MQTHLQLHPRHNQGHSGLAFLLRNQKCYAIKEHRHRERGFGPPDLGLVGLMIYGNVYTALMHFIDTLH